MENNTKYYSLLIRLTDGEYKLITDLMHKYKEKNRKEVVMTAIQKLKYEGLPGRIKGRTIDLDRCTYKKAQDLSELIGMSPEDIIADALHKYDEAIHDLQKSGLIKFKKDFREGE